MGEVKKASRVDTFYETGQKSGREMKGTLLFECKVDGEAIGWENGAWGVKGTREKLAQ